MDQFTRLNKIIFGNGEPEKSLIVKVNEIQEKTYETEQRLTELMTRIGDMSRKLFWLLVSVVIALAGNWATNIVN